MAKQKHYSIDEAKKIVYADILALTAKEEAEVEKFVKFGFTVENKVVKKAENKRLNDAFILEYLENDQEALKTYKEKKNEPAKDENGNTKKTSTGKTKTKGFNAGRNWFAKNYPVDIDKITAEIKEAGLAKTLEEAFKEYAEKNKDDSEAMNQTEYTRDFYWKNVFVRKDK